MMFKFHIHEYLHIRENFHILYFYNDFIRVFITGLPYPDIFLYPEIFHVPEKKPYCVIFFEPVKASRSNTQV